MFIKNTVSFFLFCLMILSLEGRLVSAQDTHYWNNQYGPRAMLLSGAVIGSVSDMSGTFYNPGALGYIEKPELLLSANVYQASSLTIKDGAGEDFDLSTSDFNLLPNMFAGAFRWSWLGKNKLAYSFLTRYRFNATIKGSQTSRFDVLPEYPGEEDFAGAVSFGEDVKELWAGLTWARGVSQKVGFGITQYLSIRAQDSDAEQFAQALSDSGDIALVYDIDNYSAQVYSLLWKVGLGFDFRPLTMGVTLTTPNVQLYGSGDAVVNSTRVGLDLNEDGIPDNTFTTDIQEGVPAHYKSPLSVGAGAAFDFESTKIHASVEWFDAIDSYNVLQLESFVSQGTGQYVTRTLLHQVASVVNFAVGLEQKVGDKSTAYLSFNTDTSAYDPESDIAVTGFDIRHLAAGANFAFKDSQFMLGFSYAWGSEKIQQVIDLNPDDDEEVIDPQDEVDLVYSRFTFMLGVSVKL